jgi:hypothetical protein
MDGAVWAMQVGQAAGAQDRAWTSASNGRHYCKSMGLEVPSVRSVEITFIGRTTCGVGVTT